mgnify:CR=1 FL=1
MKTYTLAEIREIVSKLAAQYGAKRVYLFGSYARGEATKNSDVDLRVDKGNLRGMFALGALYSDLEDSLGKDLDLLTTGSLDQRFLDQIAGEEIVLYDRTKS